MDTTLIVSLLGIFSVITVFCTEGCKKILDEIKVLYSSNILALIVACIVGVGGTASYYIINSIEFNKVNIVFMIFMGFATAACSMFGYDKVTQAITQLKK